MLVKREGRRKIDLSEENIKESLKGAEDANEEKKNL